MNVEILASYLLLKEIDRSRAIPMPDTTEIVLVLPVPKMFKLQYQKTFVLPVQA